MGIQEHIIKMVCSKCKRANYWTRKHRKRVERKLDYKKHCKWCKAHTTHKEKKK